jgi:hypothetical protein
MLYQSDRHFRLWLYSVSHSALLLRATKDVQHGQHNTIDIECWGVNYMQIPSSLNGVAIEKVFDSSHELSKFAVHDRFIYKLAIHRVCSL